MIHKHAGHKGYSSAETGLILLGKQPLKYYEKFRIVKHLFYLYIFIIYNIFSFMFSMFTVLREGIC